MRLIQTMTYPVFLILTVTTATIFSTRVQAECSTQDNYVILVHGGYAGGEDTKEITPETRELTKSIVAQAKTELNKGASALDVVENVIVSFENSGLLDAGKGSFENSAGFVETDASIMDGATGKSGAVAAMQQIKNPIKAARLVMEKTPHILFVGQAGEATLIDLGAEVVVNPGEYFRPIASTRSKTTGHGTVGATALDRCGKLAAGTSTGGTFNKMPGRVGDSPIIGASTFANEGFALSATGKGELFIKRGATRDIVARVEYTGVSLKEAADYVIKELIGKQDSGRGAIIAISAHGEMVTSSTGYGILHGFATNEIDPTVGVQSD